MKYTKYMLFFSNQSCLTGLAVQTSLLKQNTNFCAIYELAYTKSVKRKICLFLYVLAFTFVLLSIIRVFGSKRGRVCT